MPKTCDNKSVGLIVFQNDNILLIERKRIPFGFACPAGHLDEDGDNFEAAGKRELKEEVGIEAKNLKLLSQGRKENPCRREGGRWHYWRIYQVEAEGEIKRSEDETKQAGWYDRSDLATLAQKTESYQEGNIKEEDWQKSPGLEPVWYEFFKDLKII